MRTVFLAGVAVGLDQAFIKSSLFCSNAFAYVLYIWSQCVKKLYPSQEFEHKII
jgi:hypothetical protein